MTALLCRTRAAQFMFTSSTHSKVITLSTIQAAFEIKRLTTFGLILLLGLKNRDSRPYFSTSNFICHTHYIYNKKYLFCDIIILYLLLVQISELYPNVFFNYVIQSLNFQQFLSSSWHFLADSDKGLHFFR